jgi:hypothetical protein
MRKLALGSAMLPSVAHPALMLVGHPRGRGLIESACAQSVLAHKLKSVKQRFNWQR